MRRFVFWTGMSSLLAGVGLQFSAVSTRVFPTEHPGMTMHLFGIVAIFLGVMLMFCSRDLQHRGTLAAWEGILRLGGFVVMAGFGIFGAAGLRVTMCGVFDLLIGVAYLVFLPRYLGVSLTQLLLDRQQ